MAQERFIERKHAVDSFLANDKYLGLFSPGRYAGFDGMANISTLTCDIVHTTTGVITYDRASHLSIGQRGVWLTRQGVVVKESEAIPSITLDTNSGEAEPRVDIVVGVHEYDDVTIGGQAATYAVIKGTPGLGAPALTDETRQVILGYVHLAPGQTTLTGAEWVSAHYPGPGLSKLVTVSQVAFMEKMIGFNQETSVVTAQAAGGNYSWDYALLGDSGNFFRINPDGNNIALLPVRQAGTVIWVQFTNSTQLEQRVPSTDDKRYGMAGIQLGTSLYAVKVSRWYQLISVKDSDLSGDTHWKVMGWSSFAIDYATMESTVSSHTNSISSLTASLSGKKNTSGFMTWVDVPDSEVVEGAYLESVGDSVRYGKDDSNIVYLQGTVEVEQNTLGWRTLFTLPDTYRPGVTLYKQILDHNGNKILFQVAYTGVVQIDNNSATLGQLSLDFISFPADQ